MPSPSQLSIKISSVQRLMKEKASYYKDAAQQEKKIADMEEAVKSKSPEEAEEVSYDIKQRKQALEETRKMFPHVKDKLRDAVDALKIELETAEDGEEKTKAEAAVKDGETALVEDRN